MGASYRQIKTDIWEDDWFIDLTAEEKVLFFWLFSNRRASVSGLYPFSVKVAARETGLARETVEQAMASFAQAGKAYQENGWVWVVNLRKHNDSFSPTTWARIQADLDAVPDGALKERYQAYYQDRHEQYRARRAKSAPNPASTPATPAIPHPYPLDTPSMGHGYPTDEQRTENKEHRTENTEQTIEPESQKTSVLAAGAAQGPDRMAGENSASAGLPNQRRANGRKKATRGEKTAQPRAPSARQLAVQDFEARFLAVTHLPPPSERMKFSERQKLWWGPLAEMLEIASGEIPRAEDILRRAVAKMQTEHLTYSSPLSVLKTYRHQAACTNEKDTVYLDW